MTSKAVTYGQIAYEAYRAHSGGKSLVSGAQIPAWDDADPVIRSAWEAAGNAVYDAVQS
jgi:hypothetical protein